MPSEIFYWLFNMSIAAAITGLPVLLVRMIRRFPRRFAVVLWLIPFFRMVVPIGLNSPYSIMQLLSHLSTKTIVVYEPADKVAFSMTNFASAADSYFPVVYKINLLESVFNTAFYIWGVGLFLILLCLGISYFTALRQAKAAHHLQDNLYLSEAITVPAVYGIFRPRILLPMSCAEHDKSLVLLHEQTHIRRGDNLWRVLAALITAVHWFNPLAWVFLKQFLTDLELACDECVLEKLGSAHAKEYALTLLKFKEQTTPLTSGFGGTKLKRRIQNILSFKRITWISLALFVALICVIFHVLLTNAG